MKALFENPIKAATIDKITQKLYRLALSCTILLLLSNVFWGFWFYKTTQEANQKVYVRSGKNVFAASLENQTGNRNLYQARGLVDTFLHLMYENNAETYQENVNVALGLITKADGQAIVRGFLTEKVLENYIKYNSFAKIQLDSVHLNMNVVPYQVQVLMQQQITYDGKTITNPLGLSFELVPTLYSDSNPFGLQINRYNYIAYQPQTKQP